MAAKKNTAKKGQEDTNPPVRVPPKLGTQGPDSGPSGEVVVDADAPGLATVVTGAAAVDTSTPEGKKAAKQQEKAQKLAENASVARDVKVRATRRGYLGHKIREENDVFVIQLDKDQPLPSWVEAVADENAPTTPLAHSAEAVPEFVDGDGIGHTINSADVL